MIVTNEHGLPEPLYQALCHDDYEHGGDISVTGLIQPPRIRQLTLRHDAEITEDATERIWSLIGKVGHKILEGKPVANGFQEERLYLNIAGWKVAAKPDLWREPNILDDYKFTTVWSWIYGLKTEWEQQLNCYAPFYREAGFPVEQLNITAIFRDWQKSKATQDKGYPDVQVKVMPVPLWNNHKAMDFILARKILHEGAEDLDDLNLPLCTPEERWAKEPTWAVKKKGAKRALRVFDSQSAAIDCQNRTNGATIIEHRPGKSVRCEGYCSCAPYCNQWKKIQEESNVAISKS